MALPLTGNTITMTEIRNYFGSSTSPISLRADLGPFLGITTGSITMSSTFGGYYFPAT
jgi:hypothetical protein